MSNTDKLTQGRIVRYFERWADGNVRIIWPALVIRVHADMHCTLHVFSDEPLGTLSWPIVPDVRMDRKLDAPSSWHWPGDAERDEGLMRLAKGEPTDEDKKMIERAARAALNGRRGGDL